MGLIVGARSGFSRGEFVATGIEAALAGAVKNGGEHAFADFRKNRGDIQIALDARSEILNFIGGARVLQIIEGSTVGEGGRIGARPHRAGRPADIANNKVCRRWQMQRQAKPVEMA